jgi:hypothetical protein
MGDKLPQGRFRKVTPTGRAEGNSYSRGATAAFPKALVGARGEVVEAF